MHILTVAYGHPTDPAAFDHHYDTVHAPLAAKMPGLVDLRVLRCASLDGTVPPYHLVAELTFDSLDALRTGRESAEGRAAAADVPTFADGGITMWVQHD